jgi:hypothetical protein
MTKRTRCAYCGEIAVAYRLERDGTRVPICAWHIPTGGKDDLPMPPLPPDADAPENKGTPR